MGSGVHLCAQQFNSPTHSGKDVNIAYARQSEHFKVSAQDVQMFSLAISSEAKLWLIAVKEAFEAGLVTSKS